MAREVGFVRCPRGNRATVIEFGGQKAGTYYTNCACCGSNQHGGLAAQQQLQRDMVATVFEYDEKYGKTSAYEVLGGDNPQTTQTVNETVITEDTVIEETTQPKVLSCTSEFHKDDKNKTGAGFFGFVGALIGTAVGLIGYGVLR
ncbi:hypothetical protein ACPV36_19570 [Photobacterium damselae]|uniref:hypothetical protein n=1 Tax=Photobacterium damselae TaxID=38293 RepID=UPI0040693054